MKKHMWVFLSQSIPYLMSQISHEGLAEQYDYFINIGYELLQFCII